MLTAAVDDRTAVAVAIDTVTYYYGGRHRRTFTNKINFVLRVEVILAKCRRRSMYQQNPTPALGAKEGILGGILTNRDDGRCTQLILLDRSCMLNADHFLLLHLYCN